MPNFRKLEVWRKAHLLALSVYQLTDELPNSERYGLISQMQRSAVSIPANIAEGAGRRSDRDYARFISIAVGSSNELDYHIQFARDVGFVRRPRTEPIQLELVEVRRMLLALRRRLQSS
jgi:four helix bundle protein